jgi:hypothetical protein
LERREPSVERSEFEKLRDKKLNEYKKLPEQGDYGSRVLYDLCGSISIEVRKAFLDGCDWAFDLQASRIRELEAEAEKLASAVKLVADDLDAIAIQPTDIAYLETLRGALSQWHAFKAKAGL